MLSRIAESLFWIGRYVERADDTARLLDVHVQILLEDPWAEEDLACRSLLSVMDRAAPPEHVDVGREFVLDMLAYDRFAPSSIAGSLVSARENARRAREIISTELWECLNATWNQLPSHMRPARPHDYFTWVRERAAIVAGIMDSATSRDDTWNFMVLGRSIERADMTARLLTTRALAGSAGPSWTTLLRSCGAHEAFLRTYRGLETDREAAEFLLLDRLFPRSVMWALTAAERSLNDLESAHQRAGFTDEALRLVGKARADLEYRPLAEVLRDVPGEMRALQLVCRAAADAVSARYFDTTEAVSWAGGRQ